MNNQEKIIFQQARDFGATFNVSLTFLRQNFRALFTSLLLIGGPLLLISSACGAMYQSNSINLMYVAANSPAINPLARYGLWFLLFMVTTILSTLALTGTTFSFMALYRERGPGAFTVSDVASRLWKHAGNIFLGFLLILAICIAAVVIIVLFFGIVGAMVPILAAILGILLVFGMIIIMPPFVWLYACLNIPIIDEGVNAGVALSRVRKVLRGEFWWTWLIVLCAMIAVGVASFVFALPQLVYQMVLIFTSVREGLPQTSIPFLLVSTVCTFGSTLLYSVLYVIFGFHYYSVKEKKDGEGLMSKINEIGQP